MSQSKKAAKSVVIMIILGLASKLLGLGREMLIATKFGSGFETDTYFVALTATNLFTTFITDSINTTMIPILSQVEVREGKKGKVMYTNNLLNTVLLLSLFMVILGCIIAPYIIKVLANGFKGEQFELAVLMTRIGFPVMFFAVIVGVFRGYLQSELVFAESAASQFPYNITYIFFLLFLSNIFGIKGLMFTNVLAVGSMILIQINGMKKAGYSYKFIIDFKDKYVKKAIFLVPPILISVAVNDINKIVDRSLASTLVDGSISALNYANLLNSLILGIFITAIITAIFPILSNEASKDNHGDFKGVIVYGINTILLVTIPATVAMVIFSTPIVRIVFERGAFDSNATYMTAGALMFYSVGLVGMSLKLFLNKAFYSLQDTKTPMINSFIAVGLNIILNLIMMRFMSYRGLALATAISVTITAGLLLYYLKRKIVSLEIMKMVICGFKTFVASLIMGVVMYLIYYTLINKDISNMVPEMVILAISCCLGLIVYFILIYLFKIDEIKWIINLIKRKFIGKEKSKNIKG